ncbi:MAG: electron transfer flavoprotein subunit beta/FixA family protein [Myxococcales bacterium]|nr:MAG: electron transfer flavoprotein subunit beta/FixA family protein [Myxococcales bacterium]
MKILVTCKQVPDPDIKIKINATGDGISTDGMKYVANYFDEIANEEALRITEKGGGEVVVVGIGPKDISQQIRGMLAMGSARAIHVVTDAKPDSDAVARILAKVVEQEKPDLILMGKQATDDDACQAGQILAQILGYPQACYASKVAVDGTKATVVREVDGGLETVEMTSPALITCDLRLNEPRYASLPNIMKAKKKEIKEVAPDALGVSPTPKVKIVKYQTPPERKAGQKVKTVDELVDKLLNEAKVL